MDPQIRLGSLFGIRIGLHYSWFVIALLLLSSLASEYRSVHPSWHPGGIGAIAALTTLLFFVSLLLHELAHALVSRSRGVPVRQIILFALGGISVLEGEPTRASDEFWIAVVGPATSFLLAGISLWLADHLQQPGAPQSFGMMFSWLGVINFGLGLFNLVPAYPMDGGRVVRALVWRVTGDLLRSTRVAVTSTRIIASIFLAWGTLQLFGGRAFQGLWICLLGWYLLQAAATSYRHVLDTSDRKSNPRPYQASLFDRHRPSAAHGPQSNL